MSAGAGSEGTVRAGLRWLHEYGFESDSDDFESVVEFAESRGFMFVHGGANAHPEWVGWPAFADELREEVARLREGLQRIADWPVEFASTQNMRDFARALLSVAEGTER